MSKKVGQAVYAHANGYKYNCFITDISGDTIEVVMAGNSNRKRLSAEFVEIATPVKINHDLSPLSGVTGWHFNAFMTFDNGGGRPFLVATCQQSRIEIEAHYSHFRGCVFGAHNTPVEDEVALQEKIEELKEFSYLLKQAILKH